MDKHDAAMGAGAGLLDDRVLDAHHQLHGQLVWLETIWRLCDMYLLEPESNLGFETWRWLQDQIIGTQARLG